MDYQLTAGQRLYIHCIKRPVGFCGALAALVLVSPIILLTIVLLHFANEGAGVFFTQARPGLHGRIFRVVKFKTMNDRRGPDGELLPDKDRLTRVGRIVRSLSIDELPQLINILRGDMAFIGPRPWKVEYLPLYTPEQMHRHDVLPGISGWAQVNGRNTISFTERIQHDLYYVQHIGLGMDMRVFLTTILRVFRRSGVVQEGEATSAPFNGHN